MKVQSFLGKATIEGLHQLDTHINDWLAKRNVTPILVKQNFGSEKYHDGRSSESIIVVSIWYEPTDDLD